MNKQQLEDAQNYLRLKAANLIEKMTIDTISAKPADPVAFMIHWLDEKGDFVAQLPSKYVETHTSDGKVKIITRVEFEAQAQKEHATGGEGGVHVEQTAGPYGTTTVTTTTQTWTQKGQGAQPVKPGQPQVFYTESKEMIKQSGGQDQVLQQGKGGQGMGSQGTIIQGIGQKGVPQSGVNPMSLSQTSQGMGSSGVYQIESTTKTTTRKRPIGVESSDEEDHDVVDELPSLLKRNNANAMRTSVSAESYTAQANKPPFKPRIIPKPAEVKWRIKQMLNRLFIFSSLDIIQMDIIINSMDFKKFKRGEVVIRQGDDGNELYIIESGRFNCSKSTAGSAPMQLKVYQPGEYFGELALLYNTPRAATITAIDDGEVLSLDRETFNYIVRDSMVASINKLEKFLGEVPLLKSLQPFERSKLSDCLKIKNFNAGEYVIREGDAGDEFFLLVEGKATAFKMNYATNRQEEVFNYEEKSYFGELSLLRDEPRAATIVAITPLKVACIDRNAFKRILGPLEDIMKRNAEQYKKF